MPLSSSGYYYPVVQVPNSSYKSVDLRGLGTAPPAAGLGRIYVLSGTGDLYYKDPDGNEMLLASEISSSAGYVTGSTNFFVTNVLTVSGSVKNGIGDLILSSSVGCVVISGSLILTGSKFGNGDSDIFIGASGTVGGLRIRNQGNATMAIARADGTAGSQVFAGNFGITNGISALNRPIWTFSGLFLNPTDIMAWSPASNHGTVINDLRLSRITSGALGIWGVSGSAGITSVPGHLILSSSESGSVVAFSASADFPNSDKNYHVRSVNSALILSSSVGSLIYVSGALTVLGNAGATKLFASEVQPNSSVKNRPVWTPAGIFFDPTNTIGWSSISDVGAATNDLRLTRNSTDSSGNPGVGGFLSISGSSGSVGIIGTSGPLILSSALGSVVAISGNVYFPVDAPSGGAHITANNSHLILSSSNKSIITISGALELLTGSDGRSSIYFGKSGSADTFYPVLTKIGGTHIGILRQDTMTIGNTLGAVLGVLNLALNGDTALRNRPILRADGFFLDPDQHLSWIGAPNIGSTTNDTKLYRHATGSSGDRGTGGFIGLSGSSGSVGIIGVSGPLILSSSLESSTAFGVIVSSSFLVMAGITIKGQATFNGGLGTSNAVGIYDFRNTTRDLIFSASATSIVAVSGALKVSATPLADLPTGTENLSGSIVWDSTRKAFKIYGPEGWTPILTGAAG